MEDATAWWTLPAAADCRVRGERSRHLETMLPGVAGCPEIANGSQYPGIDANTAWLSANLPPVRFVARRELNAAL